MPDEIRKDVFERSVIISPSRSKRPGAFIDKKEKEVACPFCPGNEQMTEKTLLALPNEKHWKVRVFNNKYPVLHKRVFRPTLKDFFSKYTPCGAHEILIETRHHDKEYFSMPEGDIALIIKALKDRYQKLMEIPDINYVTIFKNKGQRAGASLVHPHMQIIAAPLFPEVISEEMQESEDFYKKAKECGQCMIMKNELKSGKRVVIRNKDWIVICPFISKWPYQTTILPKRHYSDMTQMTDSEMNSLAKVMKKLFTGYSKLFHDPPYNIMYHNFPQSDFWHFHIHVYTRLVTHAGFEFFGLNVNITPPENAKRELKKAMK